ncbi:MAG TPA: sigma-54-dependent Fis family transcriptional regulator [Nitrospirae bacterium]|nr:sigma-54-dependent Fis family transcriptional regulator [Nitrospirota bacterium]
MKNNHRARILVVDDEINAVKVLSSILSHNGYQILEAYDVDTAINCLNENHVDAVITDLRMPGKDGMQFLEYVLENHKDIPVIFLTAYGTVDSAVSAMNMGAYYYFIKPPDYNQLKGILARAVEQRRLKRELEQLKNQLYAKDNRYHIIGNTPQILKIIDTIEAIKDSSSSVMITGETGTGKELIARSLHIRSKRKDRPFVALNCATIPNNLLESELFGYERGAFTGATGTRIGKFEEAAGGTLFLDEIGELELHLQAKLLRVLQEREIERLGSNRKIKVDFRLVSSTNRDLKKEVEAGRFREDLYYRINVVEVKVPPLRERKNDIPLLATEFLKEFCIRENKQVTIDDEVMKIFYSYSWPGNIRQLKNVMERAVVLAQRDTITVRELPEELQALRKKKSSKIASLKTLKEMEVEAIKNALKECKGNKSKAARMLGISRKALYKRLREAQISI